MAGNGRGYRRFSRLIREGRGVPSPVYENLRNLRTNDFFGRILFFVKLSLPQKQTLYHELGQFLRSGIPLPQAVEALAPETGSGSLRQVLRRLEKLFLKGASVPDAFAQLRPTVGEMEVALIDASNTSGRLDQAFAYLANYFGTLEAVRASIVKQLAWPLIQLHIGVLLMTGLRRFIAGGFELQSYVLECAKLLGIVYALLLGLWIVADAVVAAARASAGLDAFLGALPILGKLRRNMALGRFCAVYEMQLQAGINVPDSLRAAADASGSARIRAAIKRAAPQILKGERVGAALGNTAAFPPALLRSFRLGEDTGSLDEDLRRWAGYHQQAAVDALERFGRWLAKATTLLILGYVGYLIVVTYQEVVQNTYGKLLSE